MSDLKTWIVFLPRACPVEWPQVRAMGWVVLLVLSSFSFSMLSGQEDQSIADPTIFGDGAEDRDLTELERRWPEEVAAIRGNDLALKTKAVERLLSSGEESVLPLLRDALKDPDREFRVLVTRGVLRTWPAKALTFFMSLTNSEVLPQREAAVFAIAYFDTSDVLTELVKALQSSEEVIHEAAARSIRAIVRPYVVEAYRSVQEQEQAKGDPALLDRFRRYQKVVVDHYVQLNQPTDLDRALFEKFANSAAAVRSRERFVQQNPDDPLAREILALGSRVSSWCPRATLPRRGRISYRIQLENLLAGSVRSIGIFADNVQFTALQFWEYPLDRAIHLDLPLDRLLLYPDLCRPRLLTKDESSCRTWEYWLPSASTLRCGLACLNLAFWEATAPDANRVQLSFDESGKPEREIVWDKDGKKLTEYRYSNWVEYRGRKMAPLHISVDFPMARVGAMDVPMEYQFRFRIDQEIWRFDSGEAIAKLDEGEILRALGVIESFQFKVKDEVNKPQSVGETEPDGTEGESEPSGGGDKIGDSSGQGSSGGVDR